MLQRSKARDDSAAFVPKMLAKIALLVALAASTYGAPLSSCNGTAPFLYVTFHGGSGSSDINQVYKYTRDGCLVSTSVLGEGGNQVELRSMYLLNGQLLVANAYQYDSRILMYGACASDGTRPFQGNFTVETATANPGMVHPYGISADATGNVYVSSQDTDLVSRYYGPANAQEHGQPMPSLVQGGYPGTFAQLSTSSQGVRDIEVDSTAGRVYVASEDDDAVEVYEMATGKNLDGLDIKKPIGLFLDEAAGVLYVGSDASSGATVQAYSFAKGKFTTEFSQKGLTHPAGITAYDGTLFVIGQDSQAIYTFDIASGKYIDKIVQDLPDSPEQILLSPC